MDISVTPLPEDGQRPYDRPVHAGLNRLAGWTFLILILVITVIALWPSARGQSLDHLDKIVHLGAHFVLALLLILARPRHGLVSLFLTISLYGAAIEVVQGIMDVGRTTSLADMAANMAGAGLAVLAWILYCRLKRHV